MAETERLGHQPQPARPGMHGEQHLPGGQGEQLEIDQPRRPSGPRATCQMVVDADVECGQGVLRSVVTTRA